MLIDLSVVSFLLLSRILCGPELLGGLMIFPLLSTLTTCLVCVQLIPRWCRRLDAEFSRDLIITRVVL